MFSSNPFPHLPSSTQIFPPNSFFQNQKHNLHKNTTDDPFISGEYIFHTDNIKQDFVLHHQKQQHFLEKSGFQNSSDQHNSDLLDSVILSCHNKKTETSKKHGHSKICTARGVRDRRVRFSIEVAQKFFTLQDLLGFDKASKTLDWLITNSLPAIKELVEETGECSSSTVTHEYKLKFLEAINGGISDEIKSKQKKISVLPKCVVGGKKTKSKRKCEGGSFRVNNAARDRLREEARARARERTREKMRVKKLDDDLKKLVSDGTNYCEYCEVSSSNLTMKSDCWREIEQQVDYKNIRWKWIMGEETS
ncbi:hypothetical protein L6452_41369 [Arctium lappa]|uniref:Uncharacterized protein n=1 Tax=Arctium lappa TaxID=4217 RepID=A0ACB8XN96_ARCLA|nr:hypothetical protein L6452_41369 [Arctium lappa]